MPNWNDDSETLLELIRQNSVLLSKYHADRYYHFKGYLKYFKLPLIVLSSVTSIASMGLTNYMQQNDISLLTCLLSLTSAIIASISFFSHSYSQPRLRLQVIAILPFKPC